MKTQTRLTDMTNFFARWRLSRLHDEDRGVSPGLARRIAGSESLSQYARTLDAIDRDLRADAPLAEPRPEARRRTLTIISELPRPTATPARAPLWPLLTSMTVASIAIMLFVARPWHTPLPRISPPSGPVADNQVHHQLDPQASGTVVNVSDRQVLEIVNDTRQLAQSFFRDALPFAAPGPDK